MQHKMKPPVIKYGVQLPSTTLPDQALTVKEILRRFSKGIPVSQRQYDPVYLDQAEYDYEAINRLSFDEKFSLADEFRQRAEQIKAEIEAQRKAKDELERKEQIEAEIERRKAQQKQPGIDHLDNTMPGDTTQKLN